jgi:hypothetical protein
VDISKSGVIPICFRVRDWYLECQLRDVNISILRPYPDTISGHNNVGCRCSAILELDNTVLGIDIGRFEVHLQFALWTLPGRLKCRFEELFVNVNAVKVVVVLSLSASTVP